MTQTESDGSILDAWSENPVATVAAVALGAAIGAGAVIGYVTIMATGDEPPIRVRNGGSIQLEVLHSTRHWRPVGSGGLKWKISGGVRLQDPYWVYIAPTDPTECGNVGKVYGNGITYVLANPKDPAEKTEVVVRSTGNHTEVTSTKELFRSEANKVLSYGSPDVYIKYIRVDGAGTPCTFQQKDVNLHSVLTE